MVHFLIDWYEDKSIFRTNKNIVSYMIPTMSIDNFSVHFGIVCKIFCCPCKETISFHLTIGSMYDCKLSFG